jgi:hypothetical protein
MKTLAVLAFILVPIATSQATIKPPQPNYTRYGSYSRQLAVHENAQRKLNELELEKYRRFREEVRKNTPKQEVHVVVRTRIYALKETK